MSRPRKKRQSRVLIDTDLSREELGELAPSELIARLQSAPLVGHAFDCGCATCFAAVLDQVLEEIRSLLTQKNAAYGNSALDPIRVFSRALPIEQIKVRIDDKLSRLMRGVDAGEDTRADLLGYLVLLRMAELRQRGTSGLGETPL